ncbi:MAG: HIT family protein [Rhizobiales bacterium]|nr:HIT family protein [Hyphomicrobiales bacterium]
MSAFTLDPTLEKDSIPLGNLRICHVRLMKDARWPWLLLIPQRPDLSELYSLSNRELEQVARDTADVSWALKQVTECDSINSGALGNIIDQLHVHVIARSDGDANWPNPVWGHGSPTEYEKGQRMELISGLAPKLFNRK